MGFTKHGTGKVLKEDQQRKTATAERDWTEDDEQALNAENDKADQ